MIPGGPLPQRIRMDGAYVIVEPLDPAKHAASLWEAVKGPENDALWEYLFDGPYRDAAAFEQSVTRKSATADPMFFAVVDRAADRALGYASYMRIEPTHRAIEVGGILFTPPIQRTRVATEAMYLMARYVFETLRYRRYEWKCDALNEPSRRAALRFGFKYEGTFRQHMIVKGRNRDTAWYSMLDSEWPARKLAFEQWLDPANFDPAGQQIRSLQ
jgi:RimJ/RimL family protein N-acetyltransferase